MKTNLKLLEALIDSVVETGEGFSSVADEWEIVALLADCRDDLIGIGFTQEEKEVD